MTTLFWILIVLGVVLISMSLRTVRQYEKGLVETLGRFSYIVDSGLNIIFPMVQSLKRVDMREQVLDVPSQEVITKDNASVTVDAIIYFQVTDPFKVTYNVANFYMAVINLAQTTLRNLIGDQELDETLSSRDKINSKLRVVLDDATDKWGVKVTRVELRTIEPPKDITDAMSRQMKAEREKRARILEAEGLQRSAILTADGEKQSNILKAEGQKQAAILDAEGKAQAIRSIAEAQKFEIETVFGAIHAGRPTNDLIAIKYLEALPKIANGQASKLFLPLESNAVLGAIGGIAELFREKTDDTSSTSRPSGFGMPAGTTGAVAKSAGAIYDPGNVMPSNYQSASYHKITSASQPPSSAKTKGGED